MHAPWLFIPSHLHVRGASPMISRSLNFGTVMGDCHCHSFTTYAWYARRHLLAARRYDTLRTQVVHEHSSPPRTNISHLRINSLPHVHPQQHDRNLVRGMKRCVGVDISSQMVSKAESRGCYTEVYCDGAVEYLESCGVGEFNTIIAADVLVYVGEPTELMLAVSKSLAPGGRFVFTTEDADAGGPQWILLPSERFAHSRPGIINACDIAGLKVDCMKDIMVRREGKDELDGCIWVLVKA